MNERTNGTRISSSRQLLLFCQCIDSSFDSIFLLGTFLFHSGNWSNCLNQVYLEPLDLIKAELDCHTNILLIKFSSGYGSVGISVASDSRGPQFESSHWRNFMNFFTINCIEKTKGRKKKEAGHCPLKKQISAVAQSL